VPIAPDVVWASDFTFISYGGTFIYLCTVIDMFTEEVLGFNISRSHDARFVRLAIERAIQRTGTVPEWFHSDQGSEYASALVLHWLQGLGVSISMNPKGSPW
jgi:putative transposase